MTDELTTTRQRCWALGWGLSLPWLICWGLLWAVAEFTPDPSVYCMDAERVTVEGDEQGLAGLAMELVPRPPIVAQGTETPGSLRPLLRVSWNATVYLDLLEPIVTPAGSVPPPPPPEWTRSADGSEAWGAIWRAGGEAGNRYLLASFSLPSLLLVPLLWCGVNALRWFRERRATAPLTVGRRAWCLTRSLVLPWGVCLGLVGLLVGLPPEPRPQNVSLRGRETTGLAARILTDRWPGHPLSVYVCWNAREHNRQLSDKSPETAAARHKTLTQWPRAGVLWSPPSGPPPRTATLVLSLWWLLPAPLLWSGFNLWRGVRRGSDQ